MKRSPSIVVSLFTLMILFSTSAQATDGNCRPVFDAMNKMATTPTHVFMTETAAFQSGKTTHSEAIYSGGAIYTNVHGKWIRGSMTSQQMREPEEQNRKDGSAACRFVRNEVVNGQAAAEYSTHSETEDAKSNGHVWISRRTGLPLREELDTGVGGKLGKSIVQSVTSTATFSHPWSDLYAQELDAKQEEKWASHES